MKMSESRHASTPGAAKQFLADVGEKTAARRDVAVGQRLLDHAPERERGNQLAAVDHTQTDEARLAFDEVGQNAARGRIE